MFFLWLLGSKRRISLVVRVGFVLRCSTIWPRAYRVVDSNGCDFFLDVCKEGLPRSNQWQLFCQGHKSQEGERDWQSSAPRSISAK